MRATISLLALCIASPALAEDFFAQAPVVAAEIYPDGATLTLRSDIELPAGEHRLMIVYPGADRLERLPRIAVSEGVTVGALGFREDVTADPRSLFTPEQTEAADALEAVEDAILAKEDELSIATSIIDALEARDAYLKAITPPENAEPDAVLQMAEFVSAQVAETAKALAEAKAGLRPIEDELTDLEATRAAAEAALERLAPPDVKNDVLTVSLIVEEAGPVALEFSEQVWDAGWRVDYDADLDRESGDISLNRKLLVFQETERPWTGAEIILSTARPNEATAPSEVMPDLATTREPRPLPTMRSESAGAVMDQMAPAPLVLAEESQVTANLKVDGLAVSYVYPDPVTILPGELAELSLDTLTIPSDPQVIAAPRFDETAFLVAEFTNGTGQPLLPGLVSLSRDGAYVGQTQLGMIPAGAEETLAFGPIEGVRLETIFQRNAEGGTGIINKSSTRTQKIAFTVENLTGEPQDVRALFPLTFSEQDELEVEITATPEPDETDIDEKRGVSAWDLVVAPGETARVEIEVSLDWPEGKDLYWNP